jgi:hypothetical protein
VSLNDGQRKEINELIEGRIAQLKAEKEAERNHKARMAEYATLRKEIEGYLQELRTLDRNVIIGVAATWAWLATYHEERLGTTHWRLAWLIPFFLVLLGWLRSFVIYRHFRCLGEYIKNNLQSKLPLGWEGCKERELDPKTPFTPLMWFVLLFGTGFLALWFGLSPWLWSEGGTWAFTLLMWAVLVIGTGFLAFLIGLWLGLWRAFWHRIQHGSWPSGPSSNQGAAPELAEPETGGKKGHPE